MARTYGKHPNVIYEIWMETRKISWCKWSIADKNETCSVLIPRAKATGGWPLTELKPSGVHTRKLLRTLNR